MNVWFEGKLITEHCPACASPMPFYPKCYRCGYSDPVIVPKEELLSLPRRGQVPEDKFHIGKVIIKKLFNPFNRVFDWLFKRWIFPNIEFKENREGK